MEIQYEAATPFDIDNLYHFNKELIDNYEAIETIDYEKVLLWVKKKLETYINDYKRILVDGELAGYYYFHPVEDKMELDDLYLFPAYQNRWIGTQVIHHCMARCDCPIFFYVFAENRAINLYKRLGAHKITDVGNTRYIMQWDNHEKS